MNFVDPARRTWVNSTVCGDKSYKKGEQNQEICRYRATTILKVIRMKNIIVWSVMDKISWKPAVYNRGRKNVCGLSKVLGTKKLQSPNIQTVKIALLDTQKRRKRARSPMWWLYYYYILGMYLLKCKGTKVNSEHMVTSAFYFNRVGSFF